MTSDLRDRKATERARLLAARRAVPASVRSLEATMLARHVAALDVSADQTVCAYVPVGSEPGSVEMLSALPGRVLLPVVTGLEPLEWALFTGVDSLRPGPLKLLEPTGPRLGPSAIREASLILVPALAVDRSGVRLGRGAGHYDRSLAQVKAPLVAVIRDSEFVDSLPGEPHDVRMTGVLTPSVGLRWL
ncbi:5-formyltetrahydrofolate cyclo-ligase [Lentzea sp. NBRC 105346]|uniref:5-formyltetrahydrofolate cyclo-ligase n=1 Tax=Lentzea sp. NBRC 105346 TaxID=3032205 RepID=UPI0024A27285|nr:5-formyltetrahydrofolate cyclo-ligase [Lentzea sp. NBRC 105346]GLZ34468.1 5-formyltetrahydrofolate cyclo-ligase [Lentzea sp. NBRC 105346]